MLPGYYHTYHRHTHVRPSRPYGTIQYHPVPFGDAWEPIEKQDIVLHSVKQYRPPRAGQLSMFAVEPVERTEGNLGHHLGDMNVGHGGGDPAMSHLFFEREQVKAFFQKMGGKTMA